MKDVPDGSNSRERRHFTPQQKVAIVKRHLIDGVPISDLCDQHQILPTQRRTDSNRALAHHLHVAPDALPCGGSKALM